MAYGFSLNTMPVWTAAAFVQLKEGEHATTRICSQDVLVMVCDGVFRFTFNGEPIELGAGEYYIMEHGLHQEGNLKCDCPLVFYIHFKENFYKSTHTLPCRGRFDTETLLSHFKKMEELIYSGASKVEKASVIYGILMALEKYNISIKVGITDKVLAVISEDFKKKYTVKELAKLCGYTENYFIQAFKKQTGKTPHSFINEMRITRAKQLLLSTDLSFTQVGEECGFDTYSNFYRAFLNSEGCSPREWVNSGMGKLQ